MNSSRFAFGGMSASLNNTFRQAVFGDQRANEWLRVVNRRVGRSGPWITLPVAELLFQAEEVEVTAAGASELLRPFFRPEAKRVAGS